MANRGLTTRIPIWVKLPGIIALVLVGVVVGSMWLGDSGIGDHGEGGRMEGMDHNGDGQRAENPAQVVTVVMKDNTFEPVEIEVKRGALVRFEFENTGALLHDFTIDEIPIEDMRAEGGITAGDRDQDSDRAVNLALKPGASGAIEFRATESGEYDFYCGEPGHRDGGMVGVVRVDTLPDNSDHDQSGDDGGHEPT